MRVLVHKRERKLYLMDGGSTMLCAPVGLGRTPAGAKDTQGDGKTPEGMYTICLIKPNGKFGRSIGLSYPNLADAGKALAEHRIEADTYRAIADAIAHSRRPPWGTPLGGEIYIHEGGAHSDWTQGCIALNADDMDILFRHHPEITQVEILRNHAVTFVRFFIHNLPYTSPGAVFFHVVCILADFHCILPAIY